MGPKSMVTTALYICLILLMPIEAATQPVLPKDDFVQGWTRSEPGLRFVKNDLYGYINGGAELFHEFGFNELLVQRYKKDDQELALEVYVMESPEAALGIYLMMCGDETPIEGVAARSSGDRSQFTVVKGNCFVQVNNFNRDKTRLAVMVTLTQQILAAVPEGQPIELFNHLPTENLVIGSERIIRGPYALQPVFTFGKGDVLQLRGKVFGLVGNYGVDSAKIYTRIVIPYPDDSAALSAYDNLLANLDPHLKIVDRRQTGFTFEDYQNRFGTVHRTDRVVEIKVGLQTEPEIPIDEE